MIDKGHLLLIALGPVQDFIAQARRSRDLWFGSHLLSELSRAAARELAGMGAKLIFPAFDNGDRELEPCDGAVRSSGRPPVTIANKVLAYVPDGADPAMVARKVRAAVREEWRVIAGKIRSNERVRHVLANDIDAIWNEQIDDFLEIYSASVPLGDDYARARHEAERALAARKMLREFRPWKHFREGAPQSSLGGTRVSVLGEDRGRPQFRNLGISPGEQLDAIGLIKRAGFKPDQFLPILNIASARWLAAAKDGAAQELDQVRVACEARNISSVQPRLPAARPFRFDASVFFPSRWPALFRELDPPGDAAAARGWGEKNVSPLLRRMRENGAGAPPFYVACLVADGDHMGRAIDRISENLQVEAAIGKCRQFSGALAGFPIEARHLVEEVHDGSLIYAGGDDVLAFLPVATAVSCAAELAACFARRLRTVVAGQAPTLSVGIGIGHALDAMGELLALAREAERLAKTAGRDRLAIVLDKRSGGKLNLVLEWKSRPLERLAEDARLLKSALSHGKIYQLAALRRRFPDPVRSAVPAEAASALHAYASYFLAHGSDGKGVKLEALGVRGDRAIYQAIGEATDRLLIARALQEAGFP